MYPTFAISIFKNLFFSKTSKEDLITFWQAQYKNAVADAELAKLRAKVNRLILYMCVCIYQYIYDKGL